MNNKKLKKARQRAWQKRKVDAANMLVMVLVATVIRRSDDEFETQLITFCSKIDTYTLPLGLDPAKVAAVKADQRLYSYLLLMHDLFFTFSQDLTTYKRLLRHGIDEQVLGAIPTIPTAPLPVPAVTFANMQKRFADLIQLCVRSSNFSTAIGEDLGIIAPSTPFDPQSGKPVFKTTYSSGGHPLLVWKKGKFDGVNIYKNDGTGWRKIDFDGKPDYIDKSDLPAAGEVKVWKYKLIYVFNDQEVGSFSEEVAVTVYGDV